MEQIVSEIIDKISNPLILVFILIFFSLLFFLRKGLNAFLSKVDPSHIFKAKDNKYNLKDLSKHDLFNELELHKRQRFEFETHGKDDLTKALIFKDFLDAKLTSTSKNMLRISSEASDEMTKQDLKAHVNQCFNDCNQCLEEELKNVFIEKGFDLKNSEIIIEKFYAVRESALEKYSRRIDSIFACDFYDNNFQLILALYEVIAFEIDDIVQHSHETFIEVNGMFYELEY